MLLSLASIEGFSIKLIENQMLKIIGLWIWSDLYFNVSNILSPYLHELQRYTHFYGELSLIKFVLQQ